MKHFADDMCVAQSRGDEIKSKRGEFNVSFSPKDVFVLLEDGDMTMSSSPESIGFAVEDEDSAKQWAKTSSFRAYCKVNIVRNAVVAEGKREEERKEWRRKYNIEEGKSEKIRKEEQEAEFQKFVEASKGKPVPVEDVEEFLSRIPPCDESLLPTKLSQREMDILEGNIERVEIEDELVESYIKKRYSRVLVPEKCGFSAHILEFWGCYSEGETIEEAYDNLNNVARSWIKACLGQALVIPEPMEYDYICWMRAGWLDGKWESCSLKDVKKG